MLIAALVIVAKTWKHPKCLWTDKWIFFKKVTIHTCNGVLFGFKNKKILSLVKMNLEDITLSEICQAQKEKYL